MQTDREVHWMLTLCTAVCHGQDVQAAETEHPHASIYPRIHPSASPLAKRVLTLDSEVK